MKTLSRIGLALAIVACFALAAQAAKDEEMVLKGDLACAHCTLKIAGVKECQDALQVKGDDGKTTNYFLVKNETAEQFGHQCEGRRAVIVTGKIMEKDGKMWIKAAKIEEVKS